MRKCGRAWLLTGVPGAADCQRRQTRTFVVLLPIHHTTPASTRGATERGHLQEIQELKVAKGGRDGPVQAVAVQRPET